MFKDITSRQIFTQNMLADNSNLQEELKKTKLRIRNFTLPIKQRIRR